MAANTQLGKTNTQTLGTTSNTEQKISGVETEVIRQSADKNNQKFDEVETVVVNQAPFWLIVALVLGWLLPSPSELKRLIKRIFNRGKKLP